MGCICSKESSVHHYIANNSENQKEEQNKSTVDVLTPPKSEEIVVEVGKVGHNEPDNTKSKPVLQANASRKDKTDKTTRIVERPTIANFNARISLDMGIHGMPHAIAGELASAGWPSWLTSVAAEAIQGWLPRSADSFEKFNKIGQGTYSSVYKARDLKTGKTVAMKKVRFVNMDPESVRFMAREINILRKLDHPNVMKLESIVTSRMSGGLYLVFEYMEHDLAGLAASPKIKFTEPQIKCYMQQLLRGLQHCHSCGVLHRDIKGSNLLIDNNGVLKIGDFGLATFFHPDQKQPLTSRVVTLWYRAPELLLGETEYGTAIDLWSVGCILAELFAGKPIMPGRTEVEQIHKIFKLCGSPTEEYWKKSKLPHATSFKPQHPYKRRVGETFKDIPSSALSLVDVLLSIEPLQRGTADSALSSEFFTAKPLPCDPSCLPKYPPSKEFDTRLREEEARRKKAEAVKGHGPESVRRGPRQSKEALTPEIDGQGQLNLKNYDNQQQGGTSFFIDPHRRLGKNTSSLSTSMVHPNAGGSSWTNKGNGAHLGPGRISPSGQGSKLRRQTSYMPQLVSGMYNAHSKGEETTLSAEDSTGYVKKKSRMHCSGPLMPPGGNLEDMLREHERHIQEAVRKARLDKERNDPTSHKILE